MSGHVNFVAHLKSSLALMLCSISLCVISGLARADVQQKSVNAYFIDEFFAPVCESVQATTTVTTTTGMTTTTDIVRHRRDLRRFRRTCIPLLKRY